MPKAEKKISVDLDDLAIDLSVDPDPSPKVGDAINYVNANRKITGQKVAAVSDSGRSVKVELIEGDKKKIVTLPYRDKSALAGNTWHWPAKAALLLLLACLAIAFVAHASLPTYHTFGPAVGSSTVPATIIMPADPNSQIRVVTAMYQSDNAAGKFSFSSGNTAYSIMFSNTVSAVTNLVNSTNGLASGQILVLQHNGSDYTNSVSNWGTYISGTNTSGYVTNQAFIVMPNTFSFGASTVSGNAGDNIYAMTTPTTWTVGATTNVLNGDDIFSGNFGRPVMVQLGPATSANALNSISSHYDSASQQ